MKAPVAIERAEQHREEKRRLHFWARSCLRKKRYRSGDCAKRMIRKLKAKGRGSLRYYYCEHCCGFHLTKAPTP